MHEVLAPAIEDLCAAFELGGYNPTPVIDIGVLVANADGAVDAREHALLGEVFQTLLETTLTRELVDALIHASVEVIKTAGVEPRVRGGWPPSRLGHRLRERGALGGGKVPDSRDRRRRGRAG